MQIRESTGDDDAAIFAMYPRAFPDEDLVPVVSELLDDRSITLSLVAASDHEIVGNVIFTDCTVECSNARVALLAPLAVAPEHQRQGVGSALVRDGLQRLRDEGYAFVCVLGDPAYYGRLGFVPEQRVEPPYPIPAEWADAWQSQHLGDAKAIDGRFRVPPPWQHEALWTA